MRYLIILGLLVFTGCASAHYVAPTGEELDYLGFLKNVDSFELEKKDTAGNEVKIKFNKSGSESDLAASLKNITELATKVIP